MMRLRVRARGEERLERDAFHGRGRRRDPRFHAPRRTGRGLKKKAFFSAFSFAFLPAFG